MKYFLASSRPKHYPQRQPAKKRSAPRPATKRKEREVSRPVPVPEKVEELRSEFKRKKGAPLGLWDLDNPALKRFYDVKGELKRETVVQRLKADLAGQAFEMGGIVSNLGATMGFTTDLSRMAHNAQEKPAIENVLVTPDLRKKLRAASKDMAEDQFVIVDGAAFRTRFIDYAVQTLVGDHQQKVSFSYLKRDNWSPGHRVLVVSGKEGYVTIAPYVFGPTDEKKNYPKIEKYLA